MGCRSHSRHPELVSGSICKSSRMLKRVQHNDVCCPRHPGLDPGSGFFSLAKAQRREGKKQETFRGEFAERAEKCSAPQALLNLTAFPCGPSGEMSGGFAANSISLRSLRPLREKHSILASSRLREMKKKADPGSAAGMTKRGPFAPLRLCERPLDSRLRGIELRSIGQHTPHQLRLGAFAPSLRILSPQGERGRGGA